MSMATGVPGGVNTFLLKYGQLIKHLTSNFIPSSKKRNVTNNTNNCTIALFPYTNEIFLRIIQIHLESHIGHETPIAQTD